MSIQSALLESSDYHGGENSLSFIAFRPVARIGVNNGEALLEYPDGRSVAKPLGETYAAADALKEFFAGFRVDGDGSELCGLFGYTAFDAVRYFENIPVREFHHRDSDAPDICYILYKFLLVFDHFKNELSIVELCADGERDHIREVETLIEDRNFASYNFRTVGERRSNLTDETYREMVRQGVRHCLRGDVFQIVLSRRFEQPFQGDDFKVYRALRSINPSPYLFYFDFGGFRIFGSSPETHCKVGNGRATIDPIAGTAFRSGNSALDRERTERLLADPKENAEHVMLVDLARNDRIALDEVAAYDRIVLSPGPGIPSEAGLLLPLIRRYAASKPILGICLGEQAIGEAFGARLENLAEVHHGVCSDIRVVADDPLFDGLGTGFRAGRYHSWVVSAEGLPDCLEVTATDRSGLIMGLRHKTCNLRGILFHPESVLTPQGKTILANWITKCNR